MTDELIVRAFEWEDPMLEYRMMALNVPRHEIEHILARKGLAFSVYVRGREPNALYPSGTPPERWDFIMPFPATKRLLIEAGYNFVTIKNCPCGEPMELWHTPKDQTIPMNPMPDDDAKAESHFATCVKAAQFRRAKK